MIDSEMNSFFPASNGSDIAELSIIFTAASALITTCIKISVADKLQNGRKSPVTMELLLLEAVVNK